MCISHDIWDSKLYAMLGVSVFFIHPVTSDRIILPVGLVRSQGKTGRIIAEQTFSILSRFGITNKDVYSCVSDNASSALLASKLLSSNKLKKNHGGLNCLMHGVDLMLEHGTGKTMRTKNKVVVDEFPELENLRKKVHRICTIISNKKRRDCLTVMTSFALNSTEQQLQELTSPTTQEYPVQY